MLNASLNAAAPAPEKPLDSLAVLLVDDYPMNVLFARRMLERLGARVDVATNGQEALDKLDALRHHIVLMDIQMPVMDGYESTRLMRLRGETVPIIALTADGTAETIELVQAAGMNAVLAKPFTPDGLVTVISQYW